MAVYEFRCAVHGPADAAFPMGEAPPEIACADCGQPSPRVFSSPRLSVKSGRSRAIAGAIEHAERTAERPDIVTSLPPKPSARAQAQAQPRPANPNWARLPRP